MHPPSVRSTGISTSKSPHGWCTAKCLRESCLMISFAVKPVVTTLRENTFWIFKKWLRQSGSVFLASAMAWWWSIISKATANSSTFSLMSCPMSKGRTFSVLGVNWTWEIWTFLAQMEPKYTSQQPKFSCIVLTIFICVVIRENVLIHWKRTPLRSQQRAESVAT